METTIYLRDSTPSQISSLFDNRENACYTFNDFLKRFINKINCYGKRIK